MAIWPSRPRSNGYDRLALGELTHEVAQNAKLIERTLNEYFA
jgi:hypothetical protein